MLRIQRRIEPDSPGLRIERELDRIGEKRAAAVRDIREVTSDTKQRLQDAVDVSFAHGGDSDGGQ